MKVINNRYYLLEKQENYLHATIYSAKDMFKNKKVTVRIYDFENVTEQAYSRLEQKLRLATSVEHSHLLHYYNFEKIWFVDEKNTYTNYYILASDQVPSRKLSNYEFPDEKQLIETAMHLLNVQYYLQRYCIGIKTCNADAVLITNDGNSVCDLMRMEIAAVPRDGSCKQAAENVAELLKKIDKKDNTRIKTLIEELLIADGPFIDFISHLIDAGYFTGDPLAYLDEKQEWTATEVGLAYEIDILSELYDFHIKRNSLIGFVFYGSDSSYKSIIINDFLNYLKLRKYLKLEIIMQNFYDFLKYLFDCVKHYNLSSTQAIETVENEFERFREINDEQILFSVQNVIAEMLFTLSITKPIVLHVKTIVGMDDHIVKFINMLFHMESAGNIVFLFDAGIEKNRFSMFYKNPRFEIISKEYSQLNDRQIKDLLSSLIDPLLDLTQLVDVIHTLNLQHAISIINFIQKLYDKRYLRLVARELVADLNAIEYDKNELMIDDALQKHLKFLKKEEKEILWYIANNGNYLTLDQLITLTGTGKEQLLDFIGSLRVHAFVDEIWDKNTASYRVVRKSLFDYFSQINDPVFVSPLRKQLIRFLAKSERDPESLSMVVKLLFNNHYYYSSLRYLNYIIDNFQLSTAEYDRLKYYAHTLLGLPKYFAEKWKIKHSYMEILFQLGHYDELWNFLEKISLSYCAHAEMVSDDTIWYYLAERYVFFYSRNALAAKRVQQLITALSKKNTPQQAQTYLVNAIKFLDARAAKKYDAAETLVEIILEGNYNIQLDAKIKIQVLSYLNNRAKYSDVRRISADLIDNWEKKLQTYPILTQYFIALFTSAGYAAIGTGDYLQAKRIYERGLFYAKKNRDFVRMISLHNNIATAKYYLGFPAHEIVEELKMAVAIGRKIGAMKQILVALANIGEHNTVNLFYSESYKYLIEAIRYTRTTDLGNYFVVLGQFIDLLVALGDFKKAKVLCRLFNKYAVKQGVVQNELAYYGHMVKLYYYERKYEQMIKFADMFLALSEENGIFNYSYFSIGLFKVDALVNRLGKKTEAKRLLDSLIVLQETRKIALGELHFDLFRSYFENDPEKRADMLEKLVVYYKKMKMNTLLLDVLLELSRIYQKKDFMYRLYEIYAEILVFAKHIKENYPKQFARCIRQHYYLSEIDHLQKACAQTLTVKPHQITYKYMLELWRKNMSDYMLRFYKKRMAALIQEWHSEQTSSNALITTILEYICEIAKADRVILFVRHPQEGLLRTAAFIKRDIFEDQEIKKDLFPLVRHPAVVVAREYSTFSTNIVNAGIYPVMQHDTTGALRMNAVAERPFQEYIAAYIYFDSKKICTNISSELGDFIFVFAQYLSLLLHQRELKEDIALCGLTKVLTRTYFLIEVDKLISHRKRDEAIGFMVIDIDTMGEINKQLGQEYGDAVIARLATIIKEFFMDTAVIGRYMGEEFAVAIAQINKEKLFEKASRLKQIIENDRELRPKNITVSIGISYLPDHGEKGEILLSKAIAAGYYAKQQPVRQRIEMWQEHYRLYRGLHDALSGIITGDIARNEEVIRTFVELSMYPSTDDQAYCAQVVTLLGRLFDHDYRSVVFTIGAERFEYRDEQIMTIDTYLETARKENNVLVAINWKYESLGMGLFSDIIYAFSDSDISLEIYLSSKLEQKEYLPADMNLMGIAARLIVSHLLYRFYTHEKLD